ncbi:SWIB complex BAF60b domain-containing protein [Striga asiatica]|uniref:SWIB complex BAF60b domain-containing protein n=1 Tax=Striga asiatica TaxID=4170 RepID=A0A5A7R6N9_STRAF|nr:SWIB complex BAF60b domain-containing protein [Striga asiatica]
MPPSSPSRIPLSTPLSQFNQVFYLIAQVAHEEDAKEHRFFENATQAISEIMNSRGFSTFFFSEQRLVGVRKTDHMTSYSVANVGLMRVDVGYMERMSFYLVAWSFLTREKNMMLDWESIIVSLLCTST